VAKRERALAIVEHLLEARTSQEFSRLSLAVAAGFLQSLTEATPLRLGHTYLRRFHSLIRPPGLGSGLEPYLTKCCISLEVKEDLRWWREYLLHDGGRFARSEFSATLVPMWAMAAELEVEVPSRSQRVPCACGRVVGRLWFSNTRQTGRSYQL
jgi:hypothetical protein